MQRKTPQRETIHAVLKEAARPLTVHEILKRASARVSSLGIATVYRCVKTLIESRDVILVEIVVQVARARNRALWAVRNLRIKPTPSPATARRATRLGTVGTPSKASERASPSGAQTNATPAHNRVHFAEESPSRARSATGTKRHAHVKRNPAAQVERAGKTRNGRYSRAAPRPAGSLRALTSKVRREKLRSVEARKASETPPPSATAMASASESVAKSPRYTRAR